MNTFGLDKNYEQFDFNEITVDDLLIISGGSGSSRGTRGPRNPQSMSGQACSNLAHFNAAAGSVSFGSALSGVGAGAGLVAGGAALFGTALWYQSCNA